MLTCVCAGMVEGALVGIAALVLYVVRRFGGRGPDADGR